MTISLARGAILYLSTVNVGTAALFAYDKHQAVEHARRVPERRLCQTAVLGGWPAGLTAMQMLRHKTRKKSFQRKYVDAMLVNALVALPVGIALFVSPVLRAAFVRDMARGFGGGRASRWGGGRKPPRFRR